MATFGFLAYIAFDTLYELAPWLQESSAHAIREGGATCVYSKVLRAIGGRGLNVQCKRNASCTKAEQKCILVDTARTLAARDCHQKSKPTKSGRKEHPLCFESMNPCRFPCLKKQAQQVTKAGEEGR